MWYPAGIADQIGHPTGGGVWCAMAEDVDAAVRPWDVLPCFPHSFLRTVAFGLAGSFHDAAAARQVSNGTLSCMNAKLDRTGKPKTTKLPQEILLVRFISP